MMAALRSALQLALSMISAGRPAPSSRPQIRLGLEELETRALLSVAGLIVPNAAPHFHLTPLADAASAPYSPAQVRHAYGFDKLSYDGAGETIAIVDAYDDPKIQADLLETAEPDRPETLPTLPPTHWRRLGRTAGSRHDSEST
jgi:hypothetical protein